MHLNVILAHLTAERISPDINAFLRDSCLLMTSIGIILSMPFVLQIFKLILLIYGIHINKKEDKIEII